MAEARPCRRSATSASGADGIHFEARLEDEKQCILMLIGATPEGRKELVGFTDGARESAHDWRGLLLNLKRRGHDVSPRLVIADGALGFWKAAGEVWPTTREQRCWAHKTANVLPSCRRANSRKPDALQEIWMAETKVPAELAFDAILGCNSWTTGIFKGLRMCNHTSSSRAGSFDCHSGR